jgi:hypothetical protein
MRTIAVANAQTSERVRTIAAPQILLVWTLPILYPLSLSAIFRSVELTQANVALGGLLALAIAWSMAGPVVGWLALNYLDRKWAGPHPKPVGGKWRLARDCYPGSIYGDAADQQ